MPIVDSHTHASTNWFEPVEMLLQQMDACGVEQAVLVQDNVQTDNSYQFACVRSSGSVIVVTLPASSVPSIQR